MPLRPNDLLPISEADHAGLVLAEDALTGLQQALDGQFVTDEDLDQAPGVSAAS